MLFVKAIFCYTLTLLIHMLSINYTLPVRNGEYENISRPKNREQDEALFRSILISFKSLKYPDFCKKGLFIRQLQCLAIDRHRSNLNYFAGAHVATRWSINGRLKIRFGPRHGSSISTSIFLEDLVRIGRVFTISFNYGSIQTRSLTSTSKFSFFLSSLYYLHPSNRIQFPITPPTCNRQRSNDSVA